MVDTVRTIDPTLDLTDDDVIFLVEEYVKVMGYAAQEGISFEETFLTMLDFHAESDGLEPTAAATCIIALSAGALQLTINETLLPGHRYNSDFLDWATITESES